MISSVQSPGLETTYIIKMHDHTQAPIAQLEWGAVAGTDTQVPDTDTGLSGINRAFSEASLAVQVGREKADCRPPGETGKLNTEQTARNGPRPHGTEVEWASTTRHGIGLGHMARNWNGPPPHGMELEWASAVQRGGA